MDATLTEILCHFVCTACAVRQLQLLADAMQDHPVQNPSNGEFSPLTAVACVAS